MLEKNQESGRKILISGGTRWYCTYMLAPHCCPVYTQSLADTKQSSPLSCQQPSQLSAAMSCQVKLTSVETTLLSQANQQSRLFLPHGHWRNAKNGKQMSVTTGVLLCAPGVCHICNMSYNTQSKTLRMLCAITRSCCTAALIMHDALVAAEITDLGV